MDGIQPKVQVVLNTLIEEKHRITSEIDNLNKLFETRDSQIANLVKLLTDLKTESRISNEQQKVMNIFKETPEKTQITSLEHPTDKKEKLKNCKIALKKHRKGIAKLAQNIKDELDVFQVCFLADLETIQARLPRPVTKTVLFSEVVHEGQEEEDSPMVCEESPVIIENVSQKEIEIGRIHFSGIKKKPKKGKK